MPSLSRPDRSRLAEKRLRSVLGTHIIATARTLEQKISDAGPFDQRIDPHILTEVRRSLIRRGEIKSERSSHGNWFYLAEAVQAMRPALQRTATNP